MSLSHNVALATVLAVVYILINGVVLYYAIKSTKSDPTDRTIYAERICRSKGYCHFLNNSVNPSIPPPTSSSAKSARLT